VLARFIAEVALAARLAQNGLELHIASQTPPTPVLRF